MAIRQNRIEVVLQIRGDRGWADRTLTDMDDEIVLPTFGLTCTVGDLYAGTHLNPRPKRGWSM